MILVNGADLHCKVLKCTSFTKDSAVHQCIENKKNEYSNIARTALQRCIQMHRQASDSWVGEGWFKVIKWNENVIHLTQIVKFTFIFEINLYVHRIISLKTLFAVS